MLLGRFSKKPGGDDNAAYKEIGLLER